MDVFQADRFVGGTQAVLDVSKRCKRDRAVERSMLTVVEVKIADVERRL